MTNRNIAVILLISFAITGLGIGLASNLDALSEFIAEITTEDKKHEKQRDEEPDNNTISPGMVNDQVEINVLSEEEEYKVSEKTKKKMKERKNGEKALKTLNKVAAGKKLNKKQQEKLETYMIDVSDDVIIGTLYDYLFENFFTSEDLNSALKRYEEGEKLETILQNFYDIEQSFVPRNYENGEIEKYMSDLNIGANELAVAEILDFRNVYKFNKIIDRLYNGDSMQDICEELGVLNTSCQMNTVNISNDEIDECVKQLNLSQEQAIQKLIGAKKAKIKDKDIINSLKKGVSEGKKIKEHYKEKFDK